MIILVKASSYGGNAIRYAMEKERAEVITKDHLPDGLTAEAIWNRMRLHCLQHRGEHTHGRPMQHFMVTFVISPSPDECRGWTSRDFAALAKEVIHEIDAADISRIPGCGKCKATNFGNSMSVSALHRDSSSGVLHLHLDACRLDMDGRTNDLHQIHVRCMKAAEIINRRHGWEQPEQIREDRRQQISDDCLLILRNMHRFNAEEYFDALRKKGYEVNLRRDRGGELCGYTVGMGATVIKASDLGCGRNLTASKLERTWDGIHKALDARKPMAKPAGTSVAEPKPQPKLQPKPQLKPVLAPETPAPLFRLDIDVDGHRYECRIPTKVKDIIFGEAQVPEESLWSTPDDIARTAVLLFCSYLDAATSMSDSCGGGGSVSSDWGRDKNEEDEMFARRCLLQAMRMHTRSRGYHR